MAKNSSSHSQKLWLYGHHAVLAALANKSRKKYQLCHCNRLDDSIRALIADSGTHIPTYEVAPKQMNQMLKIEHGQKIIHQNIALEVDRIKIWQSDEFIKPDIPYRLLMLDRLEDVQNIGAILRSAYLLGVDGVLAEQWQESAHMARASAGALELMPLVACGNIPQIIDKLKKQDFWVAGLDMAGSDVSDFTPAERQLLIMGAEGKGLHQLVKKKCDFLCKIPIAEPHPHNDYAPESLNVSVSAAIVLYALQKK